ncbi:DinB family protein [Streptomyces palmae]|uniref:DinB family protein n=1 Tax=Streptomyces palmae TaxID=1701085 RepID=UPI001AE0DD3C|nr:DinB family protein [Streptomyces palmae]
MTEFAIARPEPPSSLSDPRELVDAYLDYYRAELLRKLDGLSAKDLRQSRLPSGWTPLELLGHLTWVERRWFQWGFAAEPQQDPWGDRGPDDRWHVADEDTLETLTARFTAQCDASRAVAADVPTERRAAVGGRFSTEAEAPSLGWILFHVLQEYARHVGQLDVVRELADGRVDD